MFPLKAWWFSHVPSGKHRKSYWSHGPVEIVDLPINSMVIFHSYVTVYQRVGDSEFWEIVFFGNRHPNFGICWETLKKCPHIVFWVIFQTSYGRHSSPGWSGGQPSSTWYDLKPPTFFIPAMLAGGFKRFPLYDCPWDILDYHDPK